VVWDSLCICACYDKFGVPCMTLIKRAVGNRRLYGIAKAMLVISKTCFFQWKRHSLIPSGIDVRQLLNCLPKKLSLWEELWTLIQFCPVVDGKHVLVEFCFICWILLVSPLEVLLPLIVVLIFTVLHWFCAKLSILWSTVRLENRNCIEAHHLIDIDSKWFKPTM